MELTIGPHLPSKSYRTDFNSSIQNSLALTYYTTRSYLAVVAGLCSEADYIFIPEDPAKIDWQHRICAQLTQARTKMTKICSFF